MKVFIPMSCYPDSFADNVRVTLESMGHETRTMGQVDHKKYWSLPRWGFRVAMERIRGNRPSRFDLRILKLAREFQPDMILSTTGEVHPEVLAELGKVCSGRRILWWGDSPANSRKWGILDPGWDLVFMKDRSAVHKLRLVGRNAHLLHEAMNPVWHKPVGGQKNDSVVVAGNYYAYRQAVLLRLMGDGVPVRLYGSPPPPWAHPKIRMNHTGRYIVCEEKSRMFREGLACLNTFNLTEGNSLNCRAFEIAGAGGLQLIEYRSAVEECFEPGKELLAFRTYEELLDQIDRARKSPGEMAAIRDAGARRALAEHTYRHRLDVILRVVND